MFTLCMLSPIWGKEINGRGKSGFYCINIKTLCRLEMELDADEMMFDEPEPEPVPSVYEQMTYDPDPQLLAQGNRHIHMLFIISFFRTLQLGSSASCNLEPTLIQTSWFVI